MNMKNIFVKIIIFSIIFIFIFSISGVVLADNSIETQTSGGHATPTTEKPATSETRLGTTTTSTSHGSITSTSEVINTTTTTVSQSGTTTSKYETNYVLTPQDKVLLVRPSVCFVSSLWVTRVFDNNLKTWSKPY